jgi:hypothetical protein
MTFSDRIIPLLKKALATLEDAQAHANLHHRATVGRDIDRLRWSLEDIIKAHETEERLDAF